jgi:hypothetical protein
MSQFNRRGAYFLVLDVLPDHVKQTFGLNDKGNFYPEPPQGVVGMVMGGGKIPSDLDFAIIIYHTSDWHGKMAADLTEQLEQLYPRIQIVGIPVRD